MSERSALDTILAPGGLRPLFQPVIDVSTPEARIHSLECLMRGPEGTNMEQPNVLFEYVRLKRAEIEVDRACVGRALESALELPLPYRISVNVHASTLGRDAGFTDYLIATADGFGLPLSLITVEIVEHAPPWNGEAFLCSLDRLRAAGVRIALDDVGLGQSNFKMILDVCPDYIKIDRYFIHSSGQDTKRQAVIESVMRLAGHFGARIIAEGVEQEDDLTAVRALGVDLVQGHYFSPAISTEALGRLAVATPRRRSASSFAMDL
jgi:EAL domain-containing protein (putative c-di-GMP-specific phosphodiesterase class I)